MSEYCVEMDFIPEAYLSKTLKRLGDDAGKFLAARSFPIPPENSDPVPYSFKKPKRWFPNTI